MFRKPENVGDTSSNKFERMRVGLEDLPTKKTANNQKTKNKQVHVLHFSVND